MTQHSYVSPMLFIHLSLLLIALSNARPHGFEMLTTSPKPTTYASSKFLYSRARSIGLRVRSHAGARSSFPPVMSPPNPPFQNFFRATPEQFGGDPSGSVDSTAAVQAAVAALLNHTAFSPIMASGISNAGGATLDLAGGIYLISQPVHIPSYIGNFHVGGGGSLLASKSFPADKFLIEIGSLESCKPKDNQKVCNEFITVSDVFLDARHISAGGIHVAMTMGTTITNSFMTGFKIAGILVDQGHETMVSECWLAEYYWSETHPKEECSSLGSGGSVGILINGEDNIVSDVIIFDFTCVGVRVNGAANLLQGVHSWNGGGTAISINGSYDIQDRIVDCYLDYDVLEIVQPRYVLVENNFFYNTHTTLVPSGEQPVSWLTMKNNIYSLNQYGGNKSVVVPPGTKCQWVDIVDEIDGNQGKAGSSIVLQTRLKKSVRLNKSSKQTEYVLNFASELIFGDIDWISYTLVLVGESNATSSSDITHAAYRVNSTTVKVVVSSPVSGTIHMEVAECVNSSNYAIN